MFFLFLLVCFCLCVFFLMMLIRIKRICYSWEKLTTSRRRWKTKPEEIFFFRLFVFVFDLFLICVLKWIFNVCVPTLDIDDERTKEISFRQCLSLYFSISISFFCSCLRFLNSVSRNSSIDEIDRRFTCAGSKLINLLRIFWNLM